MLHHRKFGEHDVPTIINNTAPDFCSVYIIASGKLQSVRPAARTELTSVAPLSKRPYRSLPPNSRADQYEPEDGATYVIKKKKYTPFDPN